MLLEGSNDWLEVSWKKHGWKQIQWLTWSELEETSLEADPLELRIDRQYGRILREIGGWMMNTGWLWCDVENEAISSHISKIQLSLSGHLAYLNIVLSRIK